MSKFDILNQIKRLNFPKEVYSLFDLLEENLERVEFVKDHAGLKNFIFIAEKEAVKFEESYFACFNLDIKEGDNANNYLAMSQFKVIEIDDILNDMLDFFEETDDILFLEVGFKQSMPTQEDRFRVHQLIKNKECTDIQEAISRVKKFPEWYKAKFPKEILVETQLLKEMEAIEVSLLLKLKADLENEINQAINENNEELFYQLCERYKKVCTEIF